MNPLMRSILGSRAAFIGLKVAMTVGPIIVAERMWRDHRRGSAIALMAISNGMMALVAARNASVIASTQR